MQYEISCGALIFKRVNNEIYWLIIKSLEGIYGFPKGHMEGDETEIMTAKREIFEETGIKPCIIEGFRETDEYPLPKKSGVMKRVIYFLAEFDGQEIVYQKEELLGAELLTFDDAMKLFQFEGVKRILKKANDFLKK